MNFCLRNNPARLLATAGGGKGGRGGRREGRRIRWYGRGAEKGRLHFRDPHSGYTVIPRDVEDERETELEGKKEREGENEDERNQERHENRDRDTQMYERAKGTGTVA